ncbi:MAG: hypothetical protein EA402_12065 [Planctomycetota bacterium]|nr:MAG: hypothetical protein EA402_12065 [Planctomycetota bacterium]
MGVDCLRPVTEVGFSDAKVRRCPSDADLTAEFYRFTLKAASKRRRVALGVGFFDELMMTSSHSAFALKGVSSFRGELQWKASKVLWDLQDCKLKSYSQRPSRMNVSL